MHVDDALALLRRGWSIIPCRKGSKIPIGRWRAYQKRLPTEDEVRIWWGNHPDANAAIVTGAVSGLVVVDIDPDKGGRIQDIKETTGTLVKTGGGGWHLYYKHPGHHVGNRAGVRPGIDIRGDGGYVIAPGSLHESGELYRFVSEGEQTPCPSWAYAPVVEAERPPSGDKWLTRLLEHGCAEGERNTSMARLAGYYARKEIPVDVAHTLIGDWSRHHLRPPLGSTEIRTTVYSVYRTEEAKIRTRRSQIVVGEDVAKGEKRAHMLRFREFAVRYGAVEPSWLCEGWMPSRTIAIVAAPPESLKSWLLLDMVVSVAMGVPFLGVGKIVDPGPVLLYQQEDDLQQVVERITAIIFGRTKRVVSSLEGSWSFPALPDPPIHVHPYRELRFEEGSESLIALGDTVARLRPRLVIIDPLYSAISIDNYGRDAVAVMAPLKLLRDRYGTSFIFAHHTRKSQESWDRQEMWGSQFLNAFVEAGLQVRRIEGSPSILVRPHFKNLKAGRPQRVEFHIDTSLKSCRYEVDVREATEAEMDSAVAKKDTKAQEKPDPYQRFYEWLCEHGPADVKTVSEAMAESTRQTLRAFGKLQKDGRVFAVIGVKPLRWKAIQLT